MNCRCGEPLTECRDECRNATLYAMRGEWVAFLDIYEAQKIYPNNRYIYPPMDISVTRKKLLMFSTIHGFPYMGRVTLRAAESLHSDTRFKEMLVAVGGGGFVSHGKWYMYSYMDIAANTIEEAVLQAYIAQTIELYEANLASGNVWLLSLFREVSV